MDWDIADLGDIDSHLEAEYEDRTYTPDDDMPEDPPEVEDRFEDSVGDGDYLADEPHIGPAPCDICGKPHTHTYSEALGGDQVVLAYFCDDHSMADIRRIERQEAEAGRFYGVDARLETFGDW